MKEIKFLLQSVVVIIITSVIVYLGLTIHYGSIDFKAWEYPSSTVFWIVFFAFNTIFTFIMQLFNTIDKTNNE